MATPYKMKGSPMQRNFGIGSPLHKDKDKPDVVSQSDAQTEKLKSQGYVKIKGTNIYEHSSKYETPEETHTRRTNKQEELRKKRAKEGNWAYTKEGKVIKPGEPNYEKIKKEGNWQ